MLSHSCRNVSWEGEVYKHHKMTLHLRVVTSEEYFIIILEKGVRQWGSPVEGLWLERLCASLRPPARCPPPQTQSAHSSSVPSSTRRITWALISPSGRVTIQMVSIRYPALCWPKLLLFRKNPPFNRLCFLDAPCNHAGGVVVFGWWHGRGFGVWHCLERGASPQMKVKHSHIIGYF